MKEKKLFDSITGIDDNLIEEAKENNITKKKIRRVLAIAAGIIVIISINILIKDRDSIKYLGTIAEAIYPKAYAFDDYESRRKIREENPIDNSTISVINDFAYKTGSFILSKTDKNTNYSPLSLYYALSIATTGAKGETENELLNLLGFANSKLLSEQSGNLYRNLYKDNKIGKLKIANSIWLGNSFNGKPVHFKDSFVKNAAENFYASSYNVDFSNKDTGIVMGKWISENTNGTLTPKITTDPQNILSIINTVYFYDQWINRFDKDKTTEDIFYLLNGEEIKTEFMNQRFASAGFSKDTNFTRADLSLKNGGRMTFVLPEEGISPMDLLMSSEQMKEIFEEGEDFRGEIIWKIPKFSFDSNLELKDILNSLDIKSAFNPHANFSGITDQMAYISEVLQQTHISIDENGVEASSFTQINYVGAALPEGSAEMILNRPFIYGITEPNGSLLFIGICMNPLE